MGCRILRHCSGWQAQLRYLSLQSLQNAPGHRADVALYSTMSAKIKENSYAHDLESYHRVLHAINWQRRHYFLRMVYEDMICDGVQPMRETFHHLLGGCMKAGRLQDAMFFFEEMKSMGIVPDTLLYNILIMVCGKCNQFARAFRVEKDMEALGAHPKLETFLALLHACAVAGETDKAYEVLRRMTSSGITFNDHCYSALIIAHKNKKPTTEQTYRKIIEYLQQSKQHVSTDFKARAVTGEQELSTELLEEFANLVLGDMPFRRGTINRRLTVYHAALRAFADLKNLEALKKVIEMLEQDGHDLDAFCTAQITRGFLDHGEFNTALATFDGYMASGKPATVEMFSIMIKGALSKFTPVNMAAAKRLLRQLDEKGYFLNFKIGGELLLAASMEKGGDFSTANLIWDMMQKRKLRPPRKACMTYLDGLKNREIPDTDPRLAAVSEAIAFYDRQFRQGGQDNGGQSEIEIDTEEQDHIPAASNNDG